MNFAGLVLVCVSLLMLMCAPRSTTQITSYPSDTPDTVHQVSEQSEAPSQNIDEFDTIMPPIISPLQWIGSSFVLLRKPKMFQVYGFQLYFSPELAKEAARKETKEIAANRLAYVRGAGAQAEVIDVRPEPDGEFMVTFKLDALNLFAKTRQGVIEGLAPASDLGAAGNRWRGKTIYSRRRLIEVYDSATGNFVGRKVSIREPLTVLDAGWGFTPMPPKPILLHVARRDGTQGFIPVNYSYTNILPAKRSPGRPWDADVLEFDPGRKYSWDEAVWDSIDRAKIMPGMTTQQVRFSWGEPLQETRMGDVVRFTYSGETLEFRNDSLSASPAH